MDPYKDHANGLKSVEKEFGAACPQLYFNGQLVPILPGGVKFKRENGPGGFTIDTDIQLTVLAADFAVLPQSRQTFTYPGQNGAKYEIVSVTTMPTGVQLRLNADAAAKL
jgi:hypothetical protein